MNDTIIKLEDVWKTYQRGETEVNALSGLNLEVKKGEFLVVAGPSGSGKSTAMNMIGALDVPTKGKVYLDGTDISTLTESELAQIRGKKVGFIFQQFNLIQTLTAIENVTLPLVFQGVPKKERIQRGKEMLEEVGLGDRLHHKPSELSGGQQQRVATARALVNKPDLVLGDEPTGNLDSETGKAVMSLLKRLHEEENTTLVLVTHDPRITGYAEREVNLKDGKINNKKQKED